MKSIKRIVALMLSVMLIVLCFAGCSSSEAADEITDKTMLIAYTEENAPFIYTENGKLTGFDVEVFDKIFKDIKNDYKNYQFVQVEKGYRIGEDAAYTDADGNEYVAYVMVGGLRKNNDSFNEDCSFTSSVIDNRIIAVTAQGSAINTYADLQGKNAGVVSETAKTALDKNATIKKNMASLNEYADTKAALSALDNGEIDVLIIDEFNFNTTEGKDNYNILDGELDTISYVYAFKKWDWYVSSINSAIFELQSPDYNDADEFTPIVEKYFGYDASNFDYNPLNK